MSKQTHSGGVCHIRYHFVWSPKFRRSVLVDAIAFRLRELIHEKVTQPKGSVLALDIQPDHLHLFIEMPPKWAPAQTAYRLKGYTSRSLHQEFPRLRSRLPSLWSRPYYVGTAGEVSAGTIQRHT